MGPTWDVPICVGGCHLSDVTMIIIIVIIIIIMIMLIIIMIMISIIIIIIIIVSEALFCLCRGTNIYNSFGVCPNFKTRTTAFYTF